MKYNLFILVLLITAFTSCKKEQSTTNAKIIFKFKFDSTQARLNNLGSASVMPAGNAGQNPKMNKMSAHYMEMAPSALTLLGKGVILYHAAETTTGGANAIDFSKVATAGNNEEFFSTSISSVTPGTYEYLRVSLAYQNYDVIMRIDTVINVGGSPVAVGQDLTGTVASFIGFNTYISNYNIKAQNVTVNANKLQGYWGFESSGTIAGFPYNYSNTGQGAGTTTVVNPIAATSPIPAGSCVATGAFSGGKLTITGNETKDIVIVVSLSTNKSFEWKDLNSNGKWEPTKGEQIADMGIRGLIPTVQ